MPAVEYSDSALSAQITPDHFSGLSTYTISQGTTIRQIKVSPQPPFTPKRHMDSPTISQYSSDTSDTGSSPGTYADWQAEEQLPLQPKDSKLQAYFYRMEVNLRTCHSAALQAEAANFTRDILAKPTDVSSIRGVAETLAKAGYRKIEHSRSWALIAHDIFCQLQSTSHDASVSFRDSLVDAVMEVFDGYYLKVIGCASQAVFHLIINQVGLWHLGGLDGLSQVGEEMINVAAFVGDLFALDLLPVQMVHNRILSSLAYPNQVSTVHCRALYLFLLHAKAHIGPSIGLDVLGKVRRKLLECIRRLPMAYDRMAQLWVIVSYID
jgi:hypothetical protein